ncbi:hypothetical protein [Bacteroides finegoldii]|uniref:hypothetical protein n=1 Tax=Bacteroides finegoldii TaxID=338188 RepID=UPI0012FC5B22|nr:hypothetical protein [Bacteroides finegoldii]
MATRASAWYDYVISLLYANEQLVRKGCIIIQAWANWRCLSSEEGNARAKKVG